MVLLLPLSSIAVYFFISFVCLFVKRTLAKTTTIQQNIRSAYQLEVLRINESVLNAIRIFKRYFKWKNTMICAQIPCNNRILNIQVYKYTSRNYLKLWLVCASVCVCVYHSQSISDHFLVTLVNCQTQHSFTSEFFFQVQLNLGECFFLTLLNIIILWNYKNCNKSK